MRMNSGVGSSGSPTQNASTSGLPMPSLTSSRIFEATSVRTDARACSAGGGVVGAFKTVARNEKGGIVSSANEPPSRERPRPVVPAGRRHPDGHLGREFLGHQNDPRPA